MVYTCILLHLPLRKLSYVQYAHTTNVGFLFLIYILFYNIKVGIDTISHRSNPAGY